MVGTYTDSSAGVTHGFLIGGSTLTTIDIPGAFATTANGINNAGQIVGVYDEGSADVAHGFVKVGLAFSTLDVPGSTGTLLSGINDAGQIAGTYNGQHGNLNGFVFDGTSFTTIDYPGAGATDAGGINNAGQIVGTINQGSDGFLATPVPEPGAFLLTGIAATLTGIGMASRHDRA
jgi:hypothetical protein